MLRTMKISFGTSTPLLMTLTAFLVYSCTEYQIPDRGIEGPGLETVDQGSSCNPDTAYFWNDVLPLVVSSCATTGCHDQTTHREGVMLVDYASIIRTGGIKPGDPDDSEFFEVLTEKGEDRMPPRPYEPLSSSQIQLIREWILQGAQENRCNTACDTTGVTFSGMVWPMLQTWCTGCHSPGNPAGGVVIADYADVVSLAWDGRLMGSIRYDEGYAKMPMNQQLSDCNILLLEKWIEDGFPE
jgi:hypothetical protein